MKKILTFLILAYDIPGLAWTTYLVSNPKYREKDRRELIYKLIQGVEEEAEKYGTLQLFTVCNDKFVSDKSDLKLCSLSDIIYLRIK